VTCPTCDDNGLLGDTDDPCPACAHGERQRQYAAIERELVQAGRYGGADREAAMRAYDLGARVVGPEPTAADVERGHARMPAMTQAKRDRNTIEALKIALQQAAGEVDDAVQLVHDHVAHGSSRDAADERDRLHADVARWRAMAAPEWEALPVDATAPGGET
jgi:hypothetical protein